MRDINTALTTSLNLNDILDLLLDELSRLIPYDGGNIILIDDGQAHIARVRGYEVSRRKDLAGLPGMSFEIEKTPNLVLLTAQMKPVIISDTALDETFVPTPVSRDYHAWMGVPVINDGKVTAIFCLDKVEVGFYTEEHARLLSMFATQASLALRNASLYSAELRRIQELDGLRATLNDVTGQLDVNTLLQEIVKRATRLLNVEVGELGLYEPEEGVLRILVCENLDYDTVGTTIKIGEGVMGISAQSRQPLSITDYREWPNRLNTFDVEEVASFMAAPMLAGGNELLGVIGVGDKKRRIFSDNDIRLMSLFAQQATVALRNARLYEAARRAAEEAETIRKAGAVVVSTLNQDKALRLILEQLAQVVPYDSASVLLRRKESLQIVGGRGFKNRSAVVGIELSLDRINPGARVYLDNKPLLIKDIPAEVPHFNMLGKRSIIRSWLGVPLTIQGKPIGILSLDSLTYAAFNEESARLVSAFADQVAIALENSRLYENAVQAAGRFETL
jgi:GAF domain-containing protein